MRYRVEFTDAAEADVQAIAAYIRDQSPEAAWHWQESLTAAVGRLAEFPRRGRVWPHAEGMLRDVRQLTVGNYLVFYVVIGAIVTIVHIRHGARRAGLE